MNQTTKQVTAAGFLDIGANPDDADLILGGAALRLIRRGHVVKCVSTTNGDAGYFRMPPADLARRRHEEAQAAGRGAGLAEYLPVL